MGGNNPTSDTNVARMAGCYDLEPGLDLGGHSLLLKIFWILALVRRHTLFARLYTTDSTQTGRLHDR